MLQKSINFTCQPAFVDFGLYICDPYGADGHRERTNNMSTTKNGIRYYDASQSVPIVFLCSLGVYTKVSTSIILLTTPPPTQLIYTSSTAVVVDLSRTPSPRDTIICLGSTTIMATFVVID